MKLWCNAILLKKLLFLKEQKHPFQCSKEEMFFGRARRSDRRRRVGDRFLWRLYLLVVAGGMDRYALHRFHGADPGELGDRLAGVQPAGAWAACGVDRLFATPPDSAHRAGRGTGLAPHWRRYPLPTCPLKCSPGVPGHPAIRVWRLEDSLCARSGGNLFAFAEHTSAPAERSVERMRDIATNRGIGKPG